MSINKFISSPTVAKTAPSQALFPHIPYSPYPTKTFPRLTTAFT